MSRHAEKILFELRTSGGLAEMRSEIHPDGTTASWWRLDDQVRVKNRRRAKKIGLTVGGIVVFGVMLNFAPASAFSG